MGLFDDVLAPKKKRDGLFADVLKDSGSTAGREILAQADAIGLGKRPVLGSSVPVIRTPEQFAPPEETAIERDRRRARGMAGSVFAEDVPTRTLGELASDTYDRGRIGVRGVAGGLVELANTPQHVINLVNSSANGYAQMLGAQARIPMLPSYDWVRGTQAVLDEESKAIREQMTPTAIRQGAEFEAVDGVLPTLGYLATNPGEATGQLAEQAPQFLAAGLPGGVPVKLAGAGAFAGGQTGAQVGAENQARVKRGEITQAQADALTAQGVAGSAIVNSILPKIIPGGTVLEDALAGNKTGLTRGRGAALGLLGEGLTGGIEEAADQALQNETTGKPVGEGVGKAFALGSLLEGPVGAGAGFLSSGKPRTLGEIPPEELGAAARAAAPKADAPQTNAIDPAILAAGNAALAGDPVTVPPEATDDIDALLARNLPPDELPPAAPASASPSNEDAGAAATTEIDWQAAAEALGLPTPGAPNPAASTEQPAEPAAQPVSDDARWRRPTNGQANPVEGGGLAGTGPAAAGIAEQASAAAGGDQAIPVAPDGFAPPPPTRFSADDMRQLVGWSQRGGEMVRAPVDDRLLNAEQRDGGVAQPKGEVIGRTRWTGWDGPDGQESTFWKNRPKGITEAQANAAFDKLERGEPLTAKEQRFIDYADAVAGEYNDAMNLLDDELRGYSEIERQRGIDELRRQHDIAVQEADQAEALSVYELAHRAASAGVDPFDIAQSANEPQPAYAARLWNLIQEAGRGTDNRAAEQDRAGSNRGRESRAQGAAEGFALTQQRAPAEQATTPEEVGLFAPPTAQERNRAAQQQKDASRNGLGRDVVRPEQGDGELLAGGRPAQARVDEASESRQRGEDEADLLELRDAVEAAVGPGRVEYLHDPSGLPDRLRKGVESRMQKRGGKGKTAALYDPVTKKVYLFTGAVTTPSRAVWHVLHEIAGHHGLREFLGDKLAPALEIALQNATVKRVAEAIAKERNIDMASQSGRLLAAEEAIAELAAAVRTGNFDAIASRYKVEVPEGIRASVAKAVENFVKRLKKLLDDMFGRPMFTDEDVRGLLEAAWQAAQAEAAIGQPERALESVDNAGMAEDDYRGEHQAPTKGSGAPGHDVTGGGSFYPDDVYGPNGLRYYGTGEDAMDAEAYAVIRRLKGHPNHNVTIYRAVPKSVKGGIRAGDWVTTVRRYAVDHGRGSLSGDYKIQSKVVRANEIFTNGDSWLEWGYDPQPFDMDDLRAARERRAEKQRQNEALESTEDRIDLTPTFGTRDAKFGDTTITYGVSRDGQTVEVVMVRTPKAKRGGGSARRAMESLLAEADANGQRAVLTAEPMDSATSKAKLERFYRSLGFKPNSGRTRDFTTRATMIREPQAPLESTEDQTQSEAFKRWFGDSVVTENGKAGGKPLVVYHGTGGDFVVFKDMPGKGAGGRSARHGFFFTSSKVTASEYATETVEFARTREYDKQRRAELRGDWDEAEAIGAAAEAADFSGGMAPNVMPVYLSIKNPRIVDFGGRAYDVNSDNLTDIIREAKRMGADGVIFRNFDDAIKANDPTDHFVVFKPEQIKSALGNNGDFDPTSDSILESVEYTPEQEAALTKAGLQVDRRTSLQRTADSLREKWRSVRDTLRDAEAMKQAAFDRFHGLRHAEAQLGLNDPETSAYIAARMSAGLDAAMEAMLSFGAPVWDGGVLGIKDGTVGLLDALKPVEGMVDEWLGWMVGRRAKLLKSQGRENNLTDDDIAALLSLADGREQAFQQAARDYLKIKNAVLDVAEQAGLIDPSARAVWDHAEYIPFYRAEGDGSAGPGTRKGLQGQTSGIRTLKGGDQALADPLANIIRNFTKLVDASMKNRAVLLAVDNYGNQVFEKVGMDMAQAIVPLDQVKKHLREQGTPESVINALPAGTLKGVQRMLSIVPPSAEDVVRVMRDGKAEYYRVKDPLVLRALTAFKQPNKNIAIKPFIWFKRLLTTGVTVTPEFIAANFIRDSGSAWVISDDRFKPGWDSMRGVVNTLRNDQTTREMMMAGSTFLGGQFYDGNPDKAANAIRRALRSKGMSNRDIEGFIGTIASTPLKLWDGYLKLSGAVENANRRAVFDAAIKAGRTRTEAAYMARDLMDFAMQGDAAWVQLFSDILPFFNARLQGLYKLGRRAGTKQGKRAILLRGGVITLATVALYAWNLLAHSDGWDELEEWDKDAYWHVAPGTPYHIRIPKPFELGLLFGTAPERGMEAIRNRINQAEGDKPETTLDALIRAITGTLAFNPVPQAALPIAEQWANKRFFTGRPIENMGDEKLLPEDRKEWYTSDTMKALGRMSGISPKRLEHIWNGYTAGMGGYMLDASDVAVRVLEGAPDRPGMNLSDMPLVGRFARGGSPGRTKYGEQFYERLRKGDQIEQSIKSRLEAGDEDGALKLERENAGLLGERIPSKRAKEGFLYAKPRAMRKVRGELSAIRDEIEAIATSRNVSAEEKRQQINALEERRNKVFRDAVKSAEQ